MKRSFNSIGFNGEFMNRELPVLLVCNHMSWWDGIWAFYFNEQVLHRKFHFMMLEEQLQKYWFFKYTGGYSVSRKNRSILETIDYTVELLKHSGNVVLMFPQGEIQSMHRHEFIFEKGVEKILQKSSSPVHVVMLVNIIDYFSDAKPNLTIFFKEYTGGNSAKELEVEYNFFHADCIQEQLQIKS